MQSLCFEDPERPGEQGDMPFCVSETRNSRARAPGRQASDRELWLAMAGVRVELEVRVRPLCCCRARVCRRA